MKRKARKKQDWMYQHTEEIIALNNDILVQERQAATEAAATANAAAAAPVQPLGIDPLDQVEQRLPQTPPHQLEVVQQ